jgi:(S)-2-hydroxyglutarate dehydrogenase
MVRTDFLVVGGGVIGLNCARQLKRRYPDTTVTVLEKEFSTGMHASGRNSGVLHAGFYYSPDSLKAKFTRMGNRSLTEYCESRKIAMNKCGKLVVAKDEGEHAGLDELFKRGKLNGIEVCEVSEKEAREIEPRVRTCERALYSPTTSTVDPVKVLEAMTEDARREGIHIHCGVQYRGAKAGTVLSSLDTYAAGYVVNAAGLYADRVAKDFGFSGKYQILPFKGLYLYSNEPAGAVRTNIYPVPDLRNPFLGVHVTVTVDGKAKIGPTAIPAFWREQYSGLQNFSLSEFLDLTGRQAKLLCYSDFGFKWLALQEMRKYSRLHLVSLATSLMEGITPERYTKWGKPGIRAQLVDTHKKKLEMDFVLEGDDRSMHILNAISPAFTCSIPFTEYVCDQIQTHMKDLSPPAVSVLKS